MKLSRTDRRLLNELQRDATRNQSELAELVGMSRTSCWRRIREFEEAGLIERQVAILNPDRAYRQEPAEFRATRIDASRSHRVFLGVR